VQSIRIIRQHFNESRAELAPAAQTQNHDRILCAARVRQQRLERPRAGVKEVSVNVEHRHFVVLQVPRRLALLDHAIGLLEQLHD
jgi:hypothetical protein